MRLIEAAETLFIRKGLDDTSVDEISEMAGYSRGAFYSNFENKEQVLLSLIDSVVSCGGPQVPKALDDIFQQISGPERIAAVREWFSNQWRRNDFIALRMEFSRRAAKDRSIRKHLAKLWRQELETYTGSVCRFRSELRRWWNGRIGYRQWFGRGIGNNRRGFPGPSGKVARVLRGRGPACQQGQLLAEIEPTDYRNAFDAAEAQKASGGSRGRKRRTPDRANRKWKRLASTSNAGRRIQAHEVPRGTKEPASERLSEDRGGL
jgi:AcrR family transcriptional regulator